MRFEYDAGRPPLTAGFRETSSAMSCQLKRESPGSSEPEKPQPLSNSCSMRCCDAPQPTPLHAVEHGLVDASRQPCAKHSELPPPPAVSAALKSSRIVLTFA